MIEQEDFEKVRYIYKTIELEHIGIDKDVDFNIFFVNDMRAAVAIN